MPFCECGCGELAPISNKTDRRAGWIKDKSKRFVNGHNRRDFSRTKSPSWKGGCFTDIRGHIRILMPEHPKADCKGYVKQHTVLAEQALGGSLPPKAVVHHHSKPQLVICENQAYHLLLHKRMKEKINAQNYL